MTATKKEKPTEVKKPALPGRVALSSLTLHNVLSFGAEAKVDLEPLNVLIGPNGCGKSNLMDVVALLKAAADGELSDEFQGTGPEWVWKGAVNGKGGNGENDELPEMRVKSAWLDHSGEEYRHEMAIRTVKSGAYSIDPESEVIEHSTLARPVRREKNGDFRSSILRTATPIVWDRLSDAAMSKKGGTPPCARPEDVRRTLSDIVKDTQLYRGRHLGRGHGALNPLRRAAPTDLFNLRVMDTLENFALVFSRVHLEREDDLVKALREFYEDARGVDFQIFANRANLVLKETGGVFPMQRLSDGTLQWLLLLAILLDPTPPPLVCIDEPETGLHTDMLLTLSEMLVDASARMQLIVTTHSDMLVDCFTDLPEAVVVCDKVDGATQMKRLRAEDFHEWKSQGLGMAWMRGAIGGKRW